MVGNDGGGYINITYTSPDESGEPQQNAGVPLGEDGSLPPEALAGVGRNDPCPCGSGKKYKQCHGKLS